MKTHSRKLDFLLLFFLYAIFSSFFFQNSSAQSIQFHDATSTGGITPNDPSGFGHGSSFGDFNGDGRPDIYMISYSTANFLFRNNGSNFTDIANAAGVQFPTQSDRGMAAADYDNDGDLDMYIAAGYTGNVLYRNNGNNTFTDVTSSTNVDLDGQGQGVAWGDYNNDGRLDLFVTRSDGDNVLFRQESNHTFTDVTSSTGIGSFSASLQPVFFDVEGDGDADLLVMRQTNQANLLYINNGNGTFTERAGSWGIDSPAPHSQGAVVGDYDRDGDLDVYVCDYDGYNLLFRNDGNHFTEVAANAGARSGFTGNRGAVFGDFNDDGWLDLYVTRRNDNKMYQNNGNGTFSDVSSASGTADTNDGYSPSLADYDNDGDLDIFFSNTGQNSVLLQNDGPFHNWLQIKLVGNTSNRDGVGAVLTGWLSGQRQTQAIIAGQAYLCTGSDLTAHFALASSSKLDSLVIRWPSGTRDRFFNLSANQKLTLQESSGGGPDTTPPVISSVAASSITTSAATINWTTNEVSDSQVEYGLTTSYGALTPLSPTPLTSHVVSLSSLQANMLYHYRVKSKDAAGNLATSGDFTFTTSAQPTTILTDDFNAGTLDLNKWVKGTNTGNQAAVVSNQLELRSTGIVSGWIITKNSYPALNTTVTVKVTQPNNDGNLGMSPNYTASASSGIFNRNNWYRFYTYRNGTSGPYLLFVQWKKNGVVNGVDVTGSLVINGAVYLRLRFDQTNIHFEASLDNVNWTDTYTEAFGLPGYTLNSSFYYELAAYNTSAKGVLTVDDFAISNNAPTPDTTPPVISSVSASNITTSAATINWTTNEASDSQVEYGLTTSYGASTPLSPTLVTSHSTGLSSLQPNTLYHYRVKSKDAAGNLATSGDFTFTTVANDVTPPVISSVSASNVTTSSATINWSTNEASDSQVEYGLTTSYGASTPLSPTLLTSHVVSLSSLQANTLYHYRVKSKDAAGNLATSGDFTFTTLANDVTPPVISSVSASNVTTSAATINWSTNEASDSQVEYGLTTSYGASTPLSPTLLTSHVVSLSSLQANTLYHYRVKSRDAAGNLATSGDFTFTTSAQPTTILTDDFNAGTLDLNKWVKGTNTGNQAAVVSNQLELRSTGIVSGWIITKNSYPALNTTVTVKVTQPNNDGDLGISPNYTASASSGIFNQNNWYRFYTYRNGTSGPYLLFVQWKKNGVVNGIDVTGGLVINGAVYLRLRFDQTNIHFEASLDNVNWTDTYTEAFGLPGYTLNSSFYYELAAYNTSAKGVLTVDDFAISNNAPMPDTTPPVISSVSASNVTTSSATINWTTNEASDSQVEYGLTTSYGASTPLSPTLLTNHVVSLSSLQPNTLYHYRVKSRDAAGNLATSGDFTFTTLANDVTPPVISSVSASNVTTSAATINWTTNEASDSQVEYGLTTSYGASTPLSPTLVTSHSAGLSSLQANTLYHYRVKSKDAAGNLATSGDFTFTTLANDVTPPVISSVAASSITTSAATINWTTNEASDSQVEYGLTTSYGASTPLSPTLVTSHSAGLSSLQANTLYHYRVKSKDAAGNLATSGDFTFTTLANDVMPPVISSVSASNVTTSAATISWTTNEASDTQVEYGLTTSYGASTPLSPTPLTSHFVSLSSLQANTLYHYRVKSKDAAGNLATSGDFTFTTLAQSATILTDDFNTGTLDLNKWVKGTNTGNQSAVVGNQLELRSTGVVSGWIITKNSYAALNTTVSVKVTQPNNDGNLGISPNYTASASSGIFNQNNWYRFYTYRNGTSGPYLLYVQWKKNGVVDGVDVTGSLVINGAVYLRLRFDQTNIHFEASLDNVNWTDTYTETFGLPGYTLNSSFYYELAAYNTAAKGVLTVDDFAISNDAPMPDTTPPMISSVSASNLTTSAATISWTTNEASDSQVEYGLTTSYGASTPLSPTLVTSHSAGLSSLQGNTLYHYRVKSKDAAGNLATSGDFTFTTVNAQFIDITASAGVAGIPDFGGHAIIFADVNGDDRTDMYVTHTNFAPSATPRPFYDFDPRNPEAVFLVLPDELFINNGNNTFTENAAAAGVDDPGESHGAVFVDIDNDGDFDLFNGQRGPSGNRLYKNNGNGAFTEVTAAAGILPADRRTIGVMALDIENDGDMDLFSANWGVGNEMYVNNGAGQFAVENRGVTDVEPDSNGTMAATAADVDNDGDMDIFMSKRVDYPGDANKLYINNGAGYFTDQAAARGVAFVGHSNGAVFVDLDWDGDLDMLLAVSGIDRANPLIKLGVYRNQGNGIFVDETNVHNIPFDGFTLNAGDLDNDGDIDIFTYINSSTGQVWLNNGAGQFTQQTNAGFGHVATDVRAGTLADIDNDGDLDIAFTEINAPTSLYRNDLNTGSGAQNYLQIKLTGANSRVGLFGSKFYLYDAGHLDDPAYLRGYQQLTSTLGTLSQNFPIVHFGVTPGKNYDLRVRLLDGNSIVRTNLSPGQRLNLQTAPDTQAPVISSVAASGFTSSAATITWTTNETADSQVEYGLTTSYGASTPLSVTLVTNHSAALSGLNANTLYHYRVKSKDVAGNLATSNDFTFTTGTSATIFADDFNAGALDVNKWNKGTNAGNQTAVVSNRLQLQSQGNESGWVITRNPYAARNTIVQVKVAQPNNDGNIGITPTYTLSSQHGIYNEPNWYRFYAYRNGGTGPYLLFVEWHKNGVDGGLDVTGSLVITSQSGVYLRLRFDNTNIHFEASLNGTNWTDTYTEAFALPGYTLDTPYYYELSGYKTSTNGVLAVDDFAINSISSTPDIQPPQISGVAAQNLTTASAEIVWQTDEPADAQVEYGLTTTYGASTALNAALFTSHTVSLSNLQAGTTYHYRVHSSDAAGNLATSSDLTFTTTPGTTVGHVAFANVQDIFNNNCARCHQGATAPGGLVLLAGQAHANIVNVPSTEYPQWQRVQSGDRATSWLYTKITTVAPPVGSKMGSLTPDEIELIGDWIDQGATTTPAQPYLDLEFRTPSVINGEINISYFSGFTVWGGLPPYQFSQVGGELPPGIGLDPAGGVLYGSPTLAGVYDFTIRVSDSQLPPATVDQAYHIEVYSTREHWQLPPGYVIENVVSDLHLPVNIAFVPNPGTNPTDPYFYVTLLYGDIIMVQRNFQKQTYATGLLNFAPTAEFPGSGEIGVTGITVDPTSGDVFASMVYEGTPGAENFYGKVVRFHSADGGRTAATQTMILDGIPAGVSHMIQEVTIGPDEKLYVNLGDGWTPESAPDLNDLRGKVLRLNLDGSVPKDNPYPNSLVYASGFRNPFGAAWRQADGKLYISDNGPEFDDRLARVLPGADYGWEAILPDLTKGAIFLWNPTVAPVGMNFLENNAFPAPYFGDLFVGLSWPPYQGGLSERGKKIQRFTLNAAGQVTGDSLFLDYIGAGASTVIGVAFGPDGLYFTDLYGENGFDQFGQTRANVYRIRWGAIDETPPVITNVLATSLTGTSATIVWQTDEPATRQVEYGLTANYGSSTPVETNRSTTHSVKLSGLSPETTYHFHALSVDVANNPAISDDFTFTTTVIDTIRPVISNVQVDSSGATLAVVTWITDEPTNSYVDFGATANFGSTQSDAGFVTQHRIELIGLADSTLYHFRVRSSDVSGNETISTAGTFTTRRSLAALVDHFDSAALDSLYWNLGSNAGNQSAVINNQLVLQSQGEECGWVITKNAYAGRHTTVQANFVQPNNDGALGMTPTRTLSSPFGIFNENNWYRFYVYGPAPRRLIVQWKKNGVEGDVDVTGNLAITLQSSVYLRLRCDATKIYFEASFDNIAWTTAYSETFNLPVYSLNSAFYYELTAYNTAVKGNLIVDDFSITTVSGTTNASPPISRMTAPNLASALLPEKFALQNYPNPFSVNGTATRIRFALPQAAEVEVKIFDLAGRELNALAVGERAAGNHEVIWNGRGRNGEELSSGVYFVRLRYRTERNGSWSQLLHRVLLVK